MRGVSRVLNVYSTYESLQVEASPKTEWMHACALDAHECAVLKLVHRGYPALDFTSYVIENGILSCAFPCPLETPQQFGRVLFSVRS